MIKEVSKGEEESIALLAVNMWMGNTVEGLKEEFEQLTDSFEAVLFAYYQDNKAIGFAQCQLRYDYVEGTKSSPVGYLEGIFVMEEYRKNGIAGHLLRECELWAKKMGCSEFASDCELTNIQSAEFHKKLGFQEANRVICFQKYL